MKNEIKEYRTTKKERIEVGKALAIYVRGGGIIITACFT
jgi:hypothetical protein